jgi:hypothetical protein
MTMFVLSVAIGWWVAGRALRPVEMITTTNLDITATDLTRRIATPDERRDATAVVTRATRRMSRLLEDLLATARKRS